MQINKLAVVIVTALAVWAASARAETLDEVKGKITAKFNEMKTASYDMSTNLEMAGEGFSMKTSSSGKCEMAHEGKNWKMRMEMKSSTEQTVAETANKTVTDSLIVLNDNVMHTQSDTAGVKSVMKTKAENWGDQAGGEAFFKHMAESGELVLLPDETVNGEACYVFGVKSKDVKVVTSRYFFSKSNGMVMKMTTTNPDATPGMTMLVSNVKMGGAIPAERFKYTPPEGVTVTDMTKE